LQTLLLIVSKFFGGMAEELAFSEPTESPSDIGPCPPFLVERFQLAGLEWFGSHPVEHSGGVVDHNQQVEVAEQVAKVEQVEQEC
jgi:hypothetical protein